MLRDVKVLVIFANKKPRAAIWVFLRGPISSKKLSRSTKGSPGPTQGSLRPTKKLSGPIKGSSESTKRFESFKGHLGSTKGHLILLRSALLKTALMVRKSLALLIASPRSEVNSPNRIKWTMKLLPKRTRNKIRINSLSIKVRSVSVSEDKTFVFASLDLNLVRIKCATSTLHYRSSV